MKRRYVKAAALLVVLFAVFLPLYYAFSYGKGDGLEQTVSEGGGASGEPGWPGLLGYGDDPAATFAAGVLGLGLAFAAAYGLLRATRAWRSRDGRASHPDPPRP